MRLYDILSDRMTVNMLRVLYDQEYVHKTAHTMQFYKLRALLGGLDLDHVLKLEACGLLTAEKVEDSFVVSLNKNGKEFVEQLDKLRILVEDQKTVKAKKEYFKVEYDLTSIEQKALVLCHKMQSENGGGVLLDNLVHEIYPGSSLGRKSVVSRYMNKLARLNLVSKVAKDKNVFFELTSSGAKVLKNQLMETLV